MLISFIKFLLDPFNLLWILVLASVIAWYMGTRKLLKGLLATLGILFIISSTPLIPVLLINSLEDRYEPINIEQLPDSEAEFHILILGGGHGFDDRLPPNSLLSLNALGRLTEGIRLHRQLPNSKLLLSGSTSTPGRTTQAEMLQQTALLLGVDKEATILQEEPGNTYEEAKIYFETYGESHPVILVTSATHMPRAMLVFEQRGINPIASPANYRLRGSWKRKWFGLPSTTYMNHFHTGVSEYAALARERMRGNR